MDLELPSRNLPVVKQTDVCRSFALRSIVYSGPRIWFCRWVNGSIVQKVFESRCPWLPLGGLAAFQVISRSGCAKSRIPPIPRCAFPPKNSTAAYIKQHKILAAEMHLQLRHASLQGRGTPDPCRRCVPVRRRSLPSYKGSVRARKLRPIWSLSGGLFERDCRSAGGPRRTYD